MFVSVLFSISVYLIITVLVFIISRAFGQRFFEVDILEIIKNPAKAGRDAAKEYKAKNIHCGRCKWR